MNKSPERTRYLLLKRLKAQRYRLGWGPLWLRRFYEAIVIPLKHWLGWYPIVPKILIALIVMAIPIIIFLILRGSLPVPSRIPRDIRVTALPDNSPLQVSWPYQDPTVFQTLEVGSYPTHVQRFSGVLVGESFGLILPQLQPAPPGLRPLRLRILYTLLPETSVRNNHSCELVISNGKQILARIPQTAVAARERFVQENDSQWQKRFIPAASSRTGRLQEVLIGLDDGRIPERLSFTVVTLSATSTDAEKSPQQPALFSALADERTLNQDSCLYALGDMSVESAKLTRSNPIPQKNPLRRGVVVILAEGLNGPTTHDPRVMPQLTQWQHNEQAQILKLNEHYSVNASEKPFDDEWIALFHTAKNLGYRTGAVGWFSNTDLTDAWIHENPAYQARLTTESATDWLAQYGQAPFFLLLRYQTLRAPHKPPWEDLHLLWRRPWSGLGWRRELYNGTARYFDREWGYFIENLHALGILQQTDLLLTANHGSQIETISWEQFLGTPFNGAYGGSGKRLVRSEIHVPFILRQASAISTGPQIFKGVSTSQNLLEVFRKILLGQNSELVQSLCFDPTTTACPMSEKPLWQPLRGDHTQGFLQWVRPSAQTSFWQLDTSVLADIPQEATIYTSTVPWGQSITWGPGVWTEHFEKSKK